MTLQEALEFFPEEGAVRRVRERFHWRWRWVRGHGERWECAVTRHLNEEPVWVLQTPPVSDVLATNWRVRPEGLPPPWCAQVWITDRGPDAGVQMGPVLLSERYPLATADWYGYDDGASLMVKLLARDRTDAEERRVADWAWKMWACAHGWKFLEEMDFMDVLRGLRAMAREFPS